jgi:hypothetical protein
MLSDEYPTMNAIKNDILLTYFGNYGSSYVSTNNIPNPWMLIPNPYYLGNPPQTFLNTHGPMLYPFLNVVFTRIFATKGSQGVQMPMKAPQVTIPIGEFSIENLVPYFQLPTQSPPFRFGNSKGGIPTGGYRSPPHGNGGPLGRGSKPLGGGGGPQGKNGPQSGGGPLGGGGSKFLIGGVGVPFGAP